MVSSTPDSQCHIELCVLTKTINQYLYVYNVMFCCCVNWHSLPEMFCTWFKGILYLIHEGTSHDGYDVDSKLKDALRKVFICFHIFIGI